MQIYGKHFHNAKTQREVGTQYVYSTLLTKLASKEMHDLGVSYPVLVKPAQTEKEEIIIPGPKRSDNATVQPFGGGNGLGMGGKALGGGPGLGMMPAGDDDKTVTVDKFPFRVQFVWQEPKSAGDQIAGATGGTAAAASVPAATIPAATVPAVAPAPGAVAPAAKKP